MREVRLPVLSDSEGGTVVEWVRGDGEAVAEGESLVTIDIDKVTVDIPSPAAGILRHEASVGDEVVVGALLGWLLDEGEAEPY